MKVMKAMMVMRAMKGMKGSNQVARVRELGSTPMAAKRRAVNEATKKAKPSLPTCKVCQRAKCQTMRANGVASASQRTLFQTVAARQGM